MKSPDQSPKHFSELLQSGAVTPRTSEVLQARLARPLTEHPAFFNEVRFITLKAVCARIIPQPSGTAAVDLPGLLDERLAAGAGKGWRYDDLPPDADMYRLGMDGCDESAKALYSSPFHQLPAVQQDELLSAIQHGTAPGTAWQAVPAPRFFEELLAVLAELYYSHPAVKQLIGDHSFADAHGWQHIGLQEQQDADRQ